MSRSSRSTWSRWLRPFAIVIAMAFAFMLGIVVMYYSAPTSGACPGPDSGTTALPPSPPQPQSHSHSHEPTAAGDANDQAGDQHHCGDTRDDAVANGCQFDYLSGLWLPQVCSRSYEAEFLEMPGTGFYAEPGADLDASIGRNMSQLPFGTPYYTTRLHHVTHCLFLWLRNNDERNGVPVAQNSMGLRHQSHCANMILGMLGKGPKALWEVAVRGDVYRQSC